MLAAQDDWNAAADFHVRVDVSDKPPRVSVWGDVDLASVAALRDALDEATEDGAREIVVDLRQVTFMGSTGIRELVRVLPDLDRIEVLGPAPIVRRALQTASLGDGVVIVE